MVTAFLVKNWFYGFVATYLSKTVFIDLLLNSTTIPISKSIYNIEISDESVEAERNVVTI